MCCFKGQETQQWQCFHLPVLVLRTLIGLCLNTRGYRVLVYIITSSAQSLASHYGSLSRRMLTRQRVWLCCVGPKASTINNVSWIGAISLIRQHRNTVLMQICRFVFRMLTRPFVYTVPAMTATCSLRGVANRTGESLGNISEFDSPVWQCVSKRFDFCWDWYSLSSYTSSKTLNQTHCFV